MAWLSLHQKGRVLKIWLLLNQYLSWCAIFQQTSVRDNKDVQDFSWYYSNSVLQIAPLEIKQILSEPAVSLEFHRKWKSHHQQDDSCFKKIANPQMPATSLPLRVSLVSPRVSAVFKKYLSILMFFLSKPTLLV